jgi:hypothetical protein
MPDHIKGVRPVIIEYADVSCIPNKLNSSLRTGNLWLFLQYCALIHQRTPVIKNHLVVRANQSAAKCGMVPTGNWGVPRGGVGIAGICEGGGVPEK